MASGRSKGVGWMTQCTPTAASAANRRSWNAATESPSWRAKSRVAPSLVRTTARCATRSSSISASPGAHGIGPVVTPRALTRRVTCHQWLSGGVSAMRTLPTIWHQRWSVSFVGRHSSKGRGGQASAPGTGRRLAGATARSAPGATVTR